MRTLLWLQLLFDVVLLLAIVALERSTARRRTRRPGPRELLAEPALRERLERFRANSS